MPETSRPLWPWAWTLLLALLAGPPASAEITTTVSADYVGISHGVVALRMGASLTLAPSGYALHLTYHTAGMIGMFVHSENDSTVTGRFTGDSVSPLHFSSSGVLRGEPRKTEIAYKDGDPVIEAMAPPVESERSVVPQAQRANTVDTLSAMVLLIRSLAQSKKCDGTLTTFDGRRLTKLVARSAGEQTLPRTSRSVFSGAATRCDFDGFLLGGFKRGEDEQELKRPRHGSAWFASLVPGAPPVPVKVEFEHRVLGQVTLYLTDVSAGQPPTQSGSASR